VGKKSSSRTNIEIALRKERNIHQLTIVIMTMI
jgi:hypothetical protein